MTITEYYLESSKNVNWKSRFQSTSDKNEGKLFNYTNTNFRNLTSWINQFLNFKEYSNRARSSWEKHPNHGQEFAKQYVVNMRRSKLFKLYDDFYSLTEKGKSFERMISGDFTESESEILIFFYLQNSYFKLTPLYLFSRSNFIIQSIKDVGYLEEEIMNMAYNFLSDGIKSKIKLFTYDIFWIITFSQDRDFLMLYRNSTKQEKEDLFSKVREAYELKQRDDLIAKKYINGGVFTLRSFIDELKVLYFSYISQQTEYQGLSNYYKLMIKKYGEISNVDSEKLFNFIVEEEDVFSVIYNDLFGSSEIDLLEVYKYDNKISSGTLVAEDQSEYLANDRIDETSAKEMKSIANVSSVLKRLSKEKSNFKCELEELNNCRYFTSKDSSKNYLEIHHLIPREFANEFKNSIEIIDNYVPLCPHCHRLIHSATDRERKSALNYLFNKRMHELQDNGLELEVKELKEFYHISD